MGRGEGYLLAAGWLTRAIVLVVLSIYVREEANSLSAALEPIAHALATVRQ